jgi:muramidase (phage lysozyme)
MKDANRTTIVSFLKRNGITDVTEVQRIIGGFDLNQPVYERLIQPGECLYQFIRNVDVGTPLPATGNWFCISGATMDSLAIFSGAVGRQLVEFNVSYPVASIEGTASAIKRDWNWAGGGRGGSTQIYLPRQALFALTAIGTHLQVVGISQQTVNENSPEQVLAKEPRVRALMDVVAFAEGADYNTMVRGKGSFRITDFTRHPNVLVEVNARLKSTAAGRYQFLFSTWTELRMSDFTPSSQDLAAVKLFKRRKMLKPLLNGDIATAIRNGNKEWASLPGSPYGQPTHKIGELTEYYQQRVKFHNANRSR